MVPPASYWIKVVQNKCWSSEIDALNKGSNLKQTSRILSLKPFVDVSDNLRVGGREENAKLSYDTRHLIVLSSNHPLVKLIIRSEHLRLLHAGHLLTSASLSRRYHILVVTGQSGQSHAIVLYAGDDQPSQTHSSWDNCPRSESRLMLFSIMLAWTMLAQCI